MAESVENITNPSQNTGTSNLPDMNTMVEWYRENCYWARTMVGNDEQFEQIVPSMYKLGHSKIGQEIIESAAKIYEQSVAEKGVVNADRLKIYPFSVNGYAGSYTLDTNTLHLDPDDVITLGHELRHYVQQNSPEFVYAISTPEHFCISQKRMETETCIQDLKLSRELGIDYMPERDALYTAYLKEAAKTTSNAEEQERYATTKLERYMLDPSVKIEENLGLTKEQLEKLENSRNSWSKHYNQQTADNFKYALEHWSDKNTIEAEKESIIAMGSHVKSDLPYEELVGLYEKSFFQHGDSYNYVLGQSVLSFNYKTGKAYNIQQITDAYNIFGREYTEKLMELGIKPDKLDKDNRGLLHYAALHGDSEFITKLASMGFDVNQPDSDGIRPINLAISQGSPKAVQSLIENGAQLDVQDKWEQSPINWLYMSDSKGTDKEKIEITDILLKHGANIDQPNANGYTVLDNSISKGHLEYTKYLLEHGADEKKLKIEMDKPLLNRVILRGDVDFATELIKRGHNPNAQDEIGASSLHLAVASGNEKLVKLLLENGADPNLEDKWKQAPINWLYVNESQGKEEDRVKIVEHLLSYGADVDHPNSRGFTVLGNAVDYRHLELTKCLVENHADIHNGHNSQYISPIDRAKRREDQEFIAILSKGDKQEYVPMLDRLKAASEKVSQPSHTPTQSKPLQPNILKNNPKIGKDY